MSFLISLVIHFVDQSKLKFAQHRFLPFFGFVGVVILS